MDVRYSYEIIGAVVYGGGGPEIVKLQSELRVGDHFYANSNWYRVKMCGPQEGDECPYRALVELVEFEGRI